MCMKLTLNLGDREFEKIFVLFICLDVVLYALILCFIAGLCFTPFHVQMQFLISIIGMLAALLLLYYFLWIADKPFRILNAEQHSIETFVGNAASRTGRNAKVLDAGAGSKPYADLFTHAKYKSVDLKGDHDYMASLDKLPMEDDSFDVVLCTQVLEHVKYPQKVVKELYRIMKPSGYLYLTAPQAWGIHDEPDNYFNFTKYGLKLLFDEAGFEVISIEPRGGYFWFIGRSIRDISGIFHQHFKGIKKYFLYPLYVIVHIFTGILIPLLCFYLDRFDKEKRTTLGYACICKKSI